MKRKLPRPVFYFIFILIFGFAIWVQYAGLFNSDVLWLAGCAQKLWHGGKYYTDFFETNPPMILYLYIPPLIVIHFFHLNIAFTYTAYIFLLAILSLIICERFLRSIFCHQDSFFYQILLLALAFVYLLIPSVSWGQREHITLMLVMPYLLLVGARLEQVEIKKGLVIVAGIMAGIGFAIKPYFLIPLVFVEMYLMLKKKSFFYWMRTEALIILMVLVFYLISIFVITPEYIYKIVPLVLPLYPGSVAYPWKFVFYQVSLLFSLIIIGFYFLRKNTLRYSGVAEILLVSFGGFYVAYLLQKVPWYYHEIPFLGIMIVLAFFIFSDLLTNLFHKGKNLSNKIQAGLIFMMIIIFAPVSAINNFLIIKDYKQNQQPLFLDVIKTYGGGSVYFFTVTTPGAYPLIYYAHVQSVSRFPFFMILPQLVKNLKFNQTGELRKKTLEQKKELIQMGAEDLVKKPSLIFIGQNVEQDHFLPHGFDYIQFFSEDPLFKQLFRNYKLVTQAGFYKVYQLRKL